MAADSATAPVTTVDPLSGVGTSSIAGIKTAAKASNLVPPLQDTNDYDPASEGGGGYHLTMNAVDWSNGGDSGTTQMDAFAAWVAANYGQYSLEIIHVNQDGSTVEWKNGKKQNTGFYGQQTLSQHRNHVHWAITNNGLAAGGSPSVTATEASLNLNPLDGFGIPSTVAGAAGDAVSSAAASLFKPFIDFAIEAGMITGGLFLIVLGLVIIARKPIAKAAKAGVVVAAVAA
jgi:hypothetical protein